MPSEMKFIESSVRLIQADAGDSFEKKSELGKDHKKIKVYKIGSRNPNKYTIRVDIKVEEE